MNENYKNPDIVSMTQENFEEHMRTEIVPGVIKQIQEAADAGKIKGVREEHKIRRVPKEETEDGMEHLVTYPTKLIVIEIITGEQEREKVNPKGVTEESQ